MSGYPRLSEQNGGGGNGITQRDYMLDHFNHCARVACDSELPPHSSKRITHKLWCNFGRDPRRLRERDLQKIKLLSFRHNCIYLDGYFQSSDFIGDAESVLRKELTFATNPSRQNIELLKQISDNETVAIHIRRGDYLTEPSGIYSKCELGYYQAAVTKIVDIHGPLMLMVFSDDTQWVVANFIQHFAESHRITVSEKNQGQTAYEDLRLMSACHHNIIANSTFSWWGAWLNEYPDKIVIAPKKWYTIDNMESPFIPRNWNRI